MQIYSFTRTNTKSRTSERTGGCVVPNELLSTAIWWEKSRWSFSWRAHAVRFRNIYFPLTASDSLPGRPRHGEQVDSREFVCENPRNCSYLIAATVSAACVLISFHQTWSVRIINNVYFFSFLEENNKYL